MIICAICKYEPICRCKGTLITKHDVACSKFVSEKKPRKTPSMDESHLQQNCKRRFDSAYPELATLYFSVPNGADVSPANRKRLIAEGMVAGVSDTILLVPSYDGTFNCLCIEFKRRTHKVLKSGKLKPEIGNQSPEQKAWEQKVASHGGAYHIVSSEMEFIHIVSDYLGTNNFTVSL